MANSVFTLIIKGEIPCDKVYEDKDNIAFMTIQPMQPGHVLVVPKKEIDHLWDLPEAEYISLMMAVKKVANRMRDVLGAKRIGVKVIGDEVHHAHVHLIPFNNAAEFNAAPKDASPEELKAMAAKLAF